MSRYARYLTAAVALAISGTLTPPAHATTQEPSRLSDDQVERLLERIETAADKFRGSLDDAAR